MEKDLTKISRLAHLKEEENQEFSMFLKRYGHHKVDEIMHKLNKRYLKQYDCTECANCCKKLMPTFTQEDLEKIANYLDISYEKVKKDYVERKTAEGFILKGSECPFLLNKKCQIYDYRPEVCRSYPHLHKDNINHRLFNIIDNTYLCPIVYNIFEDLKDMIWSKDK